mmetsp:Transcript_61240/g.190253  ORF Transcript_61240/g.190253 Transcript_61240/m.190253 type:complete len:277 (+) Transcript_61240:1166-1996(+)
MTMARPLTNPSITGCGMSVMKRESLRAAAMICKMPTMKTQSAMGPMPRCGSSETCARTTAVAAEALEIMPGRPPTRAAQRPMMQPAQMPFSGETPVMKEKEIASGNAAMAVEKPASAFCSTVPSSASMLSLLLDGLSGVRLTFCGSASMLYEEPSRVIWPSFFTFCCRLSWMRRKAYITKGMQRQAHRSTTSTTFRVPSCSPEELMGMAGSGACVGRASSTANRIWKLAPARDTWDKATIMATPLAKLLCETTSIFAGVREWFWYRMCNSMNEGRA